MSCKILPSSFLFPTSPQGFELEARLVTSVEQKLNTRELAPINALLFRDQRKSTSTRSFTVISFASPLIQQAYKTMMKSVSPVRKMLLKSIRSLLFLGKASM